MKKGGSGMKRGGSGDERQRWGWREAEVVMKEGGSGDKRGGSGDVTAVASTRGLRLTVDCVNAQ